VVTAVKMQLAQHILLLEDDPADAVLIRQCLGDLFNGCELEHTPSLEQARQSLLAQCEGQGAFLPACVLVDLKLNDGSGTELIEWMWEDPRFQAIPVIVLSGDRRGYPELDGLPNVRCQITKPSEISGYEALSQALRPIIESTMSA